MNQEKINEIEKKIIEEIKKDPKISQWKLSINLNRNESNIGRHMRILKLMGVLRRIGPNHRGEARGHWELIKIEQDKLIENQKRITPASARLLEALEKNPKTSICKLCTELKRTERTLRHHVKMLRLMGLLKRVGPNHKDGYWKVLK